MKRFACLNLVLFICRLDASNAQITFDPALFHNLRGNTYTSMIYQMDASHYPAMDAIAAQTGGGQTYDFTPYTFMLASHAILPVYTSAVGSPGEGDPEFGGANYVQFLDYGGGQGFWSFYNLSDDGYDYIGSIFQSSLGTQVNKNNPPDRIYSFPLTGGSTWDQNIVSHTVGFGVESTRNIMEHNEVDGWGNLVTPMGTAPTVRLRKTRVDDVTGKSQVTLDNYFFLTNTPHSATISYNTAVGGISVVTYSVLTAGTGTANEELPQLNARLSPNFPNPFTKSTMIAFELERPQHASLRVYDVTGREVATLVDNFLAAGVHSANFKASGLTSGLYVYRLEVDGVVTTRSMMLAR